MKRSLTPSLLIAGLMLAGCGKGSNPPPPAPTAPAAPVVSGQPAAPGNSYLGGMVKAEQSAIRTVDLNSLNENCQLFNAQEGRFPKDLNELVTMHYIGQIPAAPAGMKLVYDPTTGKVTAERQQ
jgi:hypothetical protein